MLESLVQQIPCFIRPRIKTRKIDLLNEAKKIKPPIRIHEENIPICETVPRHYNIRHKTDLKAVSS